MCLTLPAQAAAVLAAGNLRAVQAGRVAGGCQCLWEPSAAVGHGSSACSPAQVLHHELACPHLHPLPADVVAVQWLLFEEGRLDVLRDTMSALTGQPGGRNAAGQLSWHAVSTGRWAVSRSLHTAKL
jgi:hypothetical protein